MISVNKSTSTNFLKQFDYLLFIAVLALSVFGLVVLFSATRQMLPNRNGDRIFIMQVICMIVGIIVAIVICRIDYTVYKVLGPFLYIGSMILLALVFIFSPINGSRSWINVKGLFTFQPAEIAKIAFVMIIAYFLERIEEEQFTKRQNTFKTLLYAVIPILLVILQPDIGTCMVFMFIGFVMFFVAGLKYKYIMWGTVATFISFPLVWYFIEKQLHIKERILVFLDPTSDPQNAGFNVINSKIAIGSGGFFGQGWMNGNLTQTASVPVKESDFIFSVVGEEFGLIGCILVVMLILIILLRCIYIALNSRDKFGSYMVIGITALFAFHAFENIGMTIGLLPVTGIPLPFVSAGGTALITYFAAIGIVLSISLKRKRKLFNA